MKKFGMEMIKAENFDDFNVLYKDDSFTIMGLCTPNGCWKLDIDTGDYGFSLDIDYTHSIIIRNNKTHTAKWICSTDLNVLSIRDID